MRTILVYTFLSIPLIGAFSIFALGISVIYRASRVLNLAHGAMAMVCAFISYSLVHAGLPMFVVLPIGVMLGGVLGVTVERVFVRRLRPQGPTAQTVGTVAVAGLLIAMAAKVWGTQPLIAPRVFPAGEVHLLGVAVRFGDIGLFVVGIAVSIGLFAFFQFTEFGLALRGAAQSRRAASLMGIDPDLASSAAWALGGCLAALAGILLAAVTNLDPYNLSLEVLPAFVATLIGGLESLPGALVGSLIAGLAFGLVPAMANLPLIGGPLRYSGASQLVLTVLALVVMAARGRRFSGAESSDAGLSGTGPSKPLKTRTFHRVLLWGIPLLILWPFLVPFSILGDSLYAMELAMVAVSLVVLIGWVGQISLGQASFVGIGAFITAIAARGLHLGFPFNAIVGALAAAAAAVILGMVALRVRGLYLAVATLIFAWMADQFLFPSPWLGAGGGSSTLPQQNIGTPGGMIFLDLTKRKTLYFIILAILVLTVALLSNLRETKVGRAFSALRGSEMAAASLGIDVVRYKLIAFGIAGLLAGVGGSLIMLEQQTVGPSQFLFTVSLQYLAVAVVGGLGSMGGAIAAAMVFASLNEVFFRVRALSGWLEVVSAGLLAFVLLAYPGGLAAIPNGIRRLRDWVRAARPRAESALPSKAAAVVETAGSTEAASEVGTQTAARRRQAPEVVLNLKRALEGPMRTVAEFTKPVRGAIGTVTSRLGLHRSKDTVSEDWFGTLVATAPEPDIAAPVPEPSQNGHSKKAVNRLLALDAVKPALALPDRSQRTALLQAEGIVVRFGGLTAVNNASLTVCEGEIVGLIGPNGAGKTTLFNAVLGLNSPASGTVRLYGNDVTLLPPHERAKFGLARTFQVIQLFSELSVFDNLLVATHLHNGSGVVSNLVAGARTIGAELEARRRVRDILGLLQLEEFANESVRGLPFGTLRMVELGRALVTGARIVMLDEPASGLNDAETDRLTSVVRRVRGLGVSILLIEHDVRMVTDISDYVYVLDQGRLIAEGEPAQIQRDPHVIAAYLGGDPDEATPAESETVKV